MIYRAEAAECAKQETLLVPTYPVYYAVGLRQLTAEDLEGDDMFWWENTHELVYEGQNVKMDSTPILPTS